jgi:hypothetical protein
MFTKCNVLVTVTVFLVSAGLHTGTLFDMRYCGDSAACFNPDSLRH